jgi:heme/copper-type cytochrome/quinol oxidase subunit 2
MSVSLIKSPETIPARESEGYVIETPTGLMDVYSVRDQKLCGPGFVTLHGRVLDSTQQEWTFWTLAAGRAVQRLPLHRAPSPVALAWME